MCGDTDTRKKSILRFQLSCDLLKSWGAQCDGLTWFTDTFPIGCSVIVGLATCDNIHWIRWVMEQVEREVWRKDEA